MSHAESRGGLPIGRLGRNTIAGAAGLVARACLQAAYLIVLTRALGADAFGAFAGAVATATVVAPLAGWGAAQLFVQHVSADRDAAPAWWAGSLAQTAASGVVVALFVVVVGAAFGGSGLGIGALAMIAGAELVALPFAWATASALLTIERAGLSALSLSLLPACRVIAVLALVLTGDVDVGTVVVAHCLASFAGAVCVVALSAAVGIRPAWSLRPPLADSLAQGTPYAAGSLASTSYTEVDKVIMLHQLGAPAVGQYTPAFRVASVMVLPITALATAALPRLFALPDGAARTRIERAIVAAAFVYGLLAAAAMVAAAPWLPHVFGDGFAGTTGFAVSLAAWIPLVALHQSHAAMLTAAGAQARRAKIEAAGLAAIVVLNLALLPRFGAAGAVYALLLAEAGLAAACVFAARRLRRAA